MTRFQAVLVGIVSTIIFLGLAWAQDSIPELPKNFPATPQELEAAKKVYDKKCVYCHGFEGKGDGPAADYVYPRPRDFTRGLYKIRTTASGQLPIDTDLYKAIAEGLHGTSMPAWKGELSEKEIRLLIHYLKPFSRRFLLSIERGKLPEPIKIVEPIQATKESIEKGKKLYNEQECWKCHGQEGRGDGPSAPQLKDDWGYPIRPANLTKSWNFRGGGTVKDIYRTFTTGLNGTPMPSYAGTISDEDNWHLANYVNSLSLEGKVKRDATVVKSKFVEGNLPETQDDPLWNEVEPVMFRLVGQIVFEPRHFTPSIDSIIVRSLHTGREVAFLLEWDDRTNSTPDEATGVYADAVAIEFPTQVVEGSRPYFVMGDVEKGVNLWYWVSGANSATEINAQGLNSKSVQKPESQNVRASVSYSNGRYRAIIKRALNTEDKDTDIQFELGEFTPIAFLAWDGSNGETEGKFSISSWYYFILEKEPAKSIYIYPAVAFLVVFGVEALIVREVRKNNNKT